MNFVPPPKLLQSHWDRLPPEIQEYVIRLATSQCIIDNRKKQQWNDVFRDLLAYHRLKEVWGKGHIRIKIEPGYLIPPEYEGNIPGLYKHIVIMGGHVDPVYGKTEIFLGYTIEDAHRTIQRWDEI